jgi:protein-tyrosine phosphatase
VKPSSFHAVRLLFVCLGNICRSPTAEGVMRHLVREAGLEDEIEIDSAGTGGWHVGSPPDERATEAAAGRGITLEGAARRFAVENFDRFDLILAMDGENLRDLQALAPDEEARAKVRLLRGPGLDVPDPYYGGSRGFEDVLDQVEEACRALLEEIRTQLR